MSTYFSSRSIFKTFIRVSYKGFGWSCVSFVLVSPFVRVAAIAIVVMHVRLSNFRNLFLCLCFSHTCASARVLQLVGSTRDTVLTKFSLNFTSKGVLSFMRFLVLIRVSHDATNNVLKLKEDWSDNKWTITERWRREKLWRNLYHDYRWIELIPDWGILPLKNRLVSTDPWIAERKEIMESGIIFSSRLIESNFWLRFWPVRDAPFC